jgi:hypothetical protein
MRIVSLLPSATEMICALGLRAQLVGVSSPAADSRKSAHDPACFPLRSTGTTSSKRFQFSTSRVGF